MIEKLVALSPQSASDDLAGHLAGGDLDRPIHRKARAPHEIGLPARFFFVCLQLLSPFHFEIPCASGSLALVQLTFEAIFIRSL